MTGVEIGKVYRNKKNHLLYRVEGIAKHSETLDAMVYYKALYPTPDPYWVRPFFLFVEKFDLA